MNTSSAEVGTIREAAMEAQYTEQVKSYETVSTRTTPTEQQRRDAWETLDAVIEHQADGRWNQNVWVDFEPSSCGFAGSYAEWRVHLDGTVFGDPDASSVLSLLDVRTVGGVWLGERLGLDADQVLWLTDSDNTLKDLTRLVTGYFGPRP